MSLKSSRSGSSVSSPSILKKTNSLFKKRLSDTLERQPQVKFSFPHMKRVQPILKEYLKDNKSKDYLKLVCFIRDSNLRDNELTELLVEATECISILNRDLRLFVEALLSIKWKDKGDPVIKAYQNFIISLLSAHNYHTRYVMESLVEMFLPTHATSVWSEIEQERCVELHNLIDILLNVVPMCKDILRKCITNQYPYYNKPAADHKLYLYNLIAIIKYQPSFRPDILHLIFANLVKLDVSYPKESIHNQNNDDEEMFQFDDIRSVASAQTQFTIIDRNVLGDALDTSLNLIFDYVISECKDDDGNFSWDKSKSLYHDLLTAFDKVLLPTYGTHHVQFIMFVFCGLKPTLAEGFLNYLWSKVCNPNVAVLLRQTAVSYVASLVARAQFIPHIILKSTLERMAEWIHSYASHQDGLDCVIPDIRLHSVYYSVCQALFYVVAFRHKDLVSNRKDVAFLQSLQLGKIVTGRLNPLRVCQLAVVKNFAAITRQYQLAYCYTIIDHNNRNNLPTIYQDDKGSSEVTGNIKLFDFFPFDPYVLEESGKRVQPLYRDYQEDILTAVTDYDVKDNQEIDDFLESSHDPTSKNTQIFSYGSSPGFMFKN